MEFYKNISDLKEEEIRVLDALITDFIEMKFCVDNFIIKKNLEENEVWGKVEEYYQEAMSRYYI